jgi:DNA-directed RNA polymerase subunit M/transcription elongation factor TFIIS
VPEGLWSKCPKCDSVLYRTDLEANAEVCPKCDYHNRISARDRLNVLLDEEGRIEIGAEVQPIDPLKFKDTKRYADRIKERVVGSNNLRNIPTPPAMQVKKSKGGVSSPFTPSPIPPPNTKLQNEVDKLEQNYTGWLNQYQEFKKILKYPEETASTDLVYAMAAQIMGPDQVTLPTGLGPNIVHMKRYINPLQCNDWTKELVWETDPLRINTIAQWGFVHYYKKEWSNE